MAARGSSGASPDTWTRLRRWTRQRARLDETNGQLTLIFAIVALALGVVVSVDPHTVPIISFAPLVVLSGMLLTTRRLLALDVLILTLVAVTFLAQGMAADELRQTAGLLVVMAVMYLASVARHGGEAPRFAGDVMLYALRDRLAAAGQIPDIPEGWWVESAIRSAHGDAFSGDFVVAAATALDRLEVALVDVSGKGRDAGTHALVLSGALGGLLGNVDPERFLPAANRYVLRQEWDERFATVAHLTLDYRSGDFLIGRAGHPPAVHYRAGLGTWSVLGGVHGPLLGVVDEPDYPLTRGRLAPGDALVIYTDGVIESPDHALEDGIDRMLGAASAAMLAGGHGLASAMCEAARSGETDDRAVFAVIRR